LCRGAEFANGADDMRTLPIAGNASLAFPPMHCNACNERDRISVDSLSNDSINNGTLGLSFPLRTR